MPPFEVLLPFIVATSIFAFTPGPGMFYMAVQTMAHGTRAGWMSSFAFHLASYLHMAFAALGVTILLTTAPTLLVVLKLAGGGYLAWMGLRMIMTQATSPNTHFHGLWKSTRRAFRDSFLVEVLNPKSALFYFAFLPQFTSAQADASIWLQIFLLGMIANVVFSITDVVCIVAARMVAARAGSSERLSSWGRRAGGTILMGMGAKVATDAA